MWQNNTNIMMQEPAATYQEPFIVVEPLGDSPECQMLCEETAWERAQRQFNEGEYKAEQFIECLRSCHSAFPLADSDFQAALINLLMARAYMMRVPPLEKASKDRLKRALRFIKRMRAAEPAQWQQLLQFMMPLSTWNSEHAAFMEELNRVAQSSTASRV